MKISSFIFVFICANTFVYANVNQFTQFTDAPSSYFGNSVSINNNTLIVGNNNISGKVIIYKFYGNSWNQVQVLTNSSCYNFGQLVLIASDGITVFVMANTSSLFSVLVYRNLVSNGNNWNYIQTISISSVLPYSALAYSYINPGYLFVAAAPFVYIYKQIGGQYSYFTQLSSTDTSDNNAVYSQISIAVDGNTLVVGAPKSYIDVSSPDGAVYIYNYSNGYWNYTNYIAAICKNCYFGTSVAYSNSSQFLIVGTQSINTIYFINADTGWKLVSTFSEITANFGQIVAISNHLALAGGFSTDCVYFFTYVDSNSTFQNTGIYDGSIGIGSQLAVGLEWCIISNFIDNAVYIVTQDAFNNCPGVPYLNTSNYVCVNCYQDAQCNTTNLLHCNTLLGVCVECNTNIDCDDSNNCTIDTCNNNNCTYLFACGGITQSCWNKNCAQCNTSSQCDDNNNCTIDSCTNGTCIHSNGITCINKSSFTKPSQTPNITIIAISVVTGVTAVGIAIYLTSTFYGFNGCLRRCKKSMCDTKESNKQMQNIKITKQETYLDTTKSYL